MNHPASTSTSAVCQPVPRLKIYAGSIIGVPAHEGIMRAKQDRVVLASKKEMHAVLNGEDAAALSAIKPALPCHSGTVFAHVAAGKTFREAAERISSLDNGYYVVYRDGEERWLYRVMDDCLDRKDAILVCDHPDFDFTADGSDRIIVPKPAFPGIVQDFPASNGWYRIDATYGIPHGKPAGSLDQDSAYIWRTRDPMVGLVSCGYSSGYKGRGVILNNPPSLALGLIAAERSLPEQILSKASEHCASLVHEKVAARPAISPSQVYLTDNERIQLMEPGQSVTQYRDALARAMVRKAANSFGFDPGEALAEVRKKLERQPNMDLAQAVLDSISRLSDGKSMN